MNKDRLLKLADFLEKQVPADKFAMHSWYKPSPSNFNKNWSASDIEALGGCGTSACALGWATAIPEFKDAGLVLSWIPLRFCGGHFTVRYKEYEAFDAASEFFDIGSMHAEFIFGNDDMDINGNVQTEKDGVGDEHNKERDNDTPQIVAARIRELVAPAT